MDLKTLALVSLALTATTFGVSGCSVGMAMHGKESPNLGLVRVGSTRGEVEMVMGAPVESVSTDGGGRIDTYEYEVGNDPSAGRAIGHGVMDVLTLGLWEVVGTPIEGFQGTRYRALIDYGADDKVAKILPPSNANKTLN